MVAIQAPEEDENLELGIIGARDKFPNSPGGINLLVEVKESSRDSVQKFRFANLCT